MRRMSSVRSWSSLASRVARTVAWIPPPAASTARQSARGAGAGPSRARASAVARREGRGPPGSFQEVALHHAVAREALEPQPICRHPKPRVERNEPDDLAAEDLHPRLGRARLHLAP